MPETSGADNLKTLALVMAAYRSAETGETVELGEV
jgi:predicted dehydrogenase